MTYRLLLGSLFLLGVVYLLLARQIELDPWSAADLVNARTLPMIYGAMLCMAVLALAASRGKSGVVAKISLPAQQRDEPAPDRSGPKTPLILKLSAIIGGFIISLIWINLWVALACLLVSSLWIMGERRWFVIYSVALGTALGGFLLVEKVLQMRVPLN